MNYELKNKINVTKDWLTELEIKGWQEIEYLQAQIANLAEDALSTQLRQLFKNLLTSYYVFTGGVETLASEPTEQIEIPKLKAPIDELDVEVNTDTEVEFEEVPELTGFANEAPEEDYEISDPFEYFVDFDDPVGEPITDKDLYNN